jgi:transposase
MRNVALDLGIRKIAYCEVAGGLVVERATATSIAGLVALIGPNTPPANVAIEACREAWTIHAKLNDWGHHALLVDTTRVKQIGVGQHGRKTDKIDAEVLARALEAGRIPLAHVLSPARQELRLQLGIRRALVETRSQFITTVRGVVRAKGGRLPSCDGDNFVVRLRQTKLGEDVRALVAPLVGVLEQVDAELRIVHGKLEKICTEEPLIVQLATVPGVGPITAAAYVSVIDDAHRFKHAHQVESYLGLVPSEDTSGMRRRIGAITKQGNPYLRSLLVECAWSIFATRDPNDPLKVWGEAIARRRGKRIASVALARRLAGVLWAMWRHGTVYDPSRLGIASAAGIAKHAQQLNLRAAALARGATKIKRGLATKKLSRAKGAITKN